MARSTLNEIEMKDMAWQAYNLRMSNTSDSRARIGGGVMLTLANPCYDFINKKHLEFIFRLLCFRFQLNVVIKNQKLVAFEGYGCLPGTRPALALISVSGCATIQGYCVQKFLVVVEQLLEREKNGGEGWGKILPFKSPQIVKIDSCLADIANRESGPSVPAKFLALILKDIGPTIDSEVLKTAMRNLQNAQNYRRSVSCIMRD